MDEFSQHAEIAQSTLSAIENNKNDPSNENLKKIILRTNINSTWLITGEGEMTRDGAMENKPDQGQALRMLLDIFESDDQQAKEAIFKNLEYFSGAVTRAKNDRRKVVDPSWPAEKERRKAVGENPAKG